MVEKNSWGHLLQEWRHGGLDVRPGDLRLDRGVRDRLLGAVVEGDDRLLAVDDKMVELGTRGARRCVSKGKEHGGWDGTGSQLLSPSRLIPAPTGLRFKLGLNVRHVSGNTKNKHGLDAWIFYL